MTASWTVSQMPDCTDKTVLITGANSGLGFEATKAFASNGATVIMACRSTERGRRAAIEIRDSIADTGATLNVRQCDLASLESIDAFTTGVERDYDRIDILCNNAGVMAIPRQETEDGFEKQLGVNHLGHFALTGKLLDLLLENDSPSRIVTHSSGAHEMGEIDFDDLHRERSYGKWEAYGQSKLANLLFAYELQRRLEAANVTDTLSVACHPGYAATNLQYRGPEEAGSRLRLGLMKAINAIVGQSAAKGSLPLLYAATARDVQGGDYYGPDGVGNMRGGPEQQSSSEASYDRQAAAKLWERSEELTGTTFTFVLD
ncbi:oxidoreductase [Halobiforma nitratireducens]|uniref:Dehydrogenase/ reductase 1 n=1 Tax=Halobiforma nitratireducens JCM 10879 TaxID=1227454 RepID=M0MN93_9EURY|nr:oxidoreductase [Halobiforma nitratireducens]EMA47157.1 dehydrogenase/ reductase 1 [Halobiforma nitratireducens JCM 10879]